MNIYEQLLKDSDKDFTMAHKDEDGYHFNVSCENFEDDDDWDEFETIRDMCEQSENISWVTNNDGVTTISVKNLNDLDEVNGLDTFILKNVIPF